VISLRFEWDPSKNRSNRRKHGVSFEVASRIFLDPLHISVPERFVGNELRWQALGMVGDVLLLMVAHTVVEEKEGEETIEVVRIISARRATRSERRRYEEENC
jgi:uncharacterized protein